MFRARITLLVVAACVGCIVLVGCGATNNVTVDNPVMPDAPPRATPVNAGRLSESGAIAASEASGRSTVVPAEFSGKTAANNGGFVDSQVVATVDGTPLFATDVLAQYEGHLRKAQLEVPPAEFQRLRSSLIKRDLQSHLENVVLVNALKSSLSPEQIEMLEASLDEMFEDQVERWKSQFQLATLSEVEAKLRQEGASLVSLRRNFFNQTMGRQFIREKVGKPRDLGRPELLAYYRKNIESYRIPARVKWRQIRIDLNREGGRPAAADALQQVIAGLRGQAAFAAMAQQFSDGPTAADGGDRGWLTRDSLSDEDIERALFSLPVGSVSQVFTGKNAYQIVLVVEREIGGHKPFGDVQSEIETAIKTQEVERTMRSVLDDLLAQATIVNYLDDGPSSASSATQPTGQE